VKRAYYLAGVAAFVPVAAGGITPAAVNAATAHASTASSRTKTVSLHPAGTSGHGAVATPAAGCTGTNEFYASYVSGDVTLYGWSTKTYRELCIGTVVVNVWFVHNNCKSVTLLVKQPSTGEQWYTQRVCGTGSTWHAVDFGLHRQWYMGGVYLSARSTYNVGYAEKQFGYGI
jgi:hypothetical protein